MMKISVCYIVKNEENNLPLSLETVKNIADELIIVDTGSTDGTVRIAKEAGARLFNFQWGDDFSAPRNFALEQATGDWIVFLDADEGFLHPEKVWEQLRKIDAMQPAIDAVMVTRVNVDLETNRQQGNDQAARLFRNLPQIRYRGRIHETIAHSTRNLHLYQDDGALTLYHTGYAGKSGLQKDERNLRLLRQDVSEYGEQPWHYMYFADCYLNLKDYDQAMKYAILALDSPIQPVASRVGLFHVAIESMRQLNWPLEDQLALSEAAIGEYPNQPEFYGERGMILCGMGRLEEAQASLERAIMLYESATSSAAAETYFTDRVAAVVYGRLGELAAMRDDREAAELYFGKALETDGANEELKEKYKHFFKKISKRA